MMMMLRHNCSLRENA